MDVLQWVHYVDSIIVMSSIVVSALHTGWDGLLLSDQQVNPSIRALTISFEVTINKHFSGWFPTHLHCTNMKSLSSTTLVYGRAAQLVYVLNHNCYNRPGMLMLVPMSTTKLGCSHYQNSVSMLTTRECYHNIIMYLYKPLNYSLVHLGNT